MSFDAAEPADIADRRLFRRMTAIGFLLFLVVWACLPNIGPVFRTYHLGSEVMEPTIEYEEATVWANRLAYGLGPFSYDWFPLPLAGRWPDLLPMRGDVIVFRLEDGRDMVMRVVGLPGDRVRLLRNELWINEAQVPRRVLDRPSDVPAEADCDSRLVEERLPEGRSFTHYEKIVCSDKSTPPLSTTPIVEVPARRLFVLGDNRDNAADSRVATEDGGVGLVPVESIVGRIEFVYDR
ncbi:signal peptidase I [Methylosinus sp. H3A]|uniref:signal peptidase I n=1 Tax=Methylosinus sp. H3A TaxID=2785786 RepID=UPI0018C1E5A9|nr:signal peptidase I [Methylosinus sp. H3A]MBG0811614.1 signal peptidase I [Methylosinus sp. H3A]